MYIKYVYCIMLTVLHLFPAGNLKTIEEKYPGSCKGKVMGGQALTQGDIEMVKRTYGCYQNVSM